MNFPSLSVIQAILLFVTGLAPLAGVGAQASGSSEAVRPTPVGQSVYLGQVYSSGRLYLAGFGNEGGASALGNWPEEVYFVPMDEEAESTLHREPAEYSARFLRLARDVNPPEVERMLPADSPCVPEGYLPRDDQTYVGQDDRLGPWEPAEYFATSEWYGCATEPTVAIYEVNHEIDASFRVVAFHPELAMVQLDWDVAGTRRPLTTVEADRIAEASARDRECTLQPRDREEARKLLAFALEDTSYRIRLSSHVAACTSLGEVFILDVLEGEQVVKSHEITRWRGNP